MMNRVIVSDCCRECFWGVTERGRSKSRGRHDGQDERLKVKMLLKIYFFKYIVLVSHHDVFHLRDQLLMNYEFAEDNGWVGICQNDLFQN
jgi:hypothetical protein